MNNRETVEPSPDGGNPESQNENREHQREADQCRRGVIPAVDREPNSCGRISGSRLAHVDVMPSGRNNKGPGSTEAFGACL
jgi:hypothetical protein